VYTATLLVKNQDNSKIPDNEISKEFMSDHVFLGISIACLARFELYCCLECLGSNKLLAIPAAAALVLIVLTHCNNYITSRYFHTQQEAYMSLVCGELMFDMPASFFFYLAARR